jgi:galactokinase
LQDRAVRILRERFGKRAHWVGVAPGRVNLIGEHTDYNDGLVLPVAIDRYCAAAAAPASGGGRLYSAELDAEIEFEAGKQLAVGKAGHGLARGSPMSTVAGVVGEYQRLGAARGNLEIVVTGNVPMGAGLSSSAAAAIAVACVLEAAWEVRVAPVERARLCQRAEQEFGGVPCGIMDQLASIMGRPGCALLLDCQTLEIREIPLPSAEVAIVVAHTGVPRLLAAQGYSARRSVCGRAAEAMGLASLRGANLATLGRSAARMNAEEYRCAHHVITENERVRKGAVLLASRDYQGFGTLMYDSHASLRDDMRVSCPELDGLVESAAGVSGVFGARMTGAGFGGCIVALAPPEAAVNLDGALREGFARRFGYPCEVWTLRGAAGASGSRAHQA